MLQVAELSKRFPGFDLGPLSFQVERGDYFVLLGPSGVGKSLILELLAGMERPDSGRLLLKGRDITQTPIQKRGVGLVFQKPALFPHLTVAANIAYGLKGRTRKETKKIVGRYAKKMGIEGLLERYPGTLSGGEAQRVALARMLAVKPKVLCLDEPLSSLDRERREELEGLLRRLNRDGQTILHVTHDFNEAFSLATRVAVLEPGEGGRTRLSQVGTPREVFKTPRSPFVARFMGYRNVFAGSVKEPGLFTPDNCVETTIPMGAAGAKGRSFVIVREDTIQLHPPSDSKSSLHGVVQDVVPALSGAHVAVRVEGITLHALISPGAVASLDLSPEAEVALSFDQESLRLLGASQP